MSDADQTTEAPDIEAAVKAELEFPEREWWQLRARVAATLWSAFAQAGMSVTEAATASGVRESRIKAMLHGADAGADTRDLFRVCHALGFRLHPGLQEMVGDN